MLGASFDDAAANRAFAQKHGYTFPLLCDTTHALALAYRACDRREDAWPRRITYVIGREGRIEQAIETRDVKGQAESLLPSLQG